MKTRFLKVVCSLLLLAACDSTLPTVPSIPEVPAFPVAPVPPPRVDTEFTWETMAGYTAFALGEPEQSEEEVRAFVAAHMANGWNTARVCAETEYWDEQPFYLIRKPRDPERLRWTLEILASIPGAQVLLIGDCTLKGAVPEAEKRDWARMVAGIAKDYKNVAIETHNEFDNCRGRGWGPHCPGKQDVAEHIRIYKNAGIPYVTADDSLCYQDFQPNGILGFRLTNVNAWPPDFHPCRNNEEGPWDPNFTQLDKLYKVNGMFLLSETVAWGDDGQCSGLRTCDKDRIQSFIDRCSQVDALHGERGCKFVFHSVNGLGGIIPGFIPVAR